MMGNWHGPFEVASPKSEQGQKLGPMDYDGEASKIL